MNLVSDRDLYVAFGILYRAASVAKMAWVLCVSLYGMQGRKFVNGGDDL